MKMTTATPSRARRFAAGSSPMTDVRAISRTTIAAIGARIARVRMRLTVV